VILLLIHEPMKIDGKKIAQTIYDELKIKIQDSPTKPCLWAILVWDSASPSLRYIKQKRKFAEQIWMEFTLFHYPADISESSLLDHIKEINKDNSVSGYIVQLPLPQHIDTHKIFQAIDPSKDIDWFHPLNQWKLMLWDESWFIPCTPKWILRLLNEYDITLAWKKVVILGRSNIVWKPMALLCINAWATVVSCNSQTPDFTMYTKDADIVILATGQAHILTESMIGSNTVVIDVGFSIIDWKLQWDATYDTILKQWNLITPVPGWVGPMTVAMLIEQCYIAHQKSLWKRKQ